MMVVEYVGLSRLGMVPKTNIPTKACFSSKEIYYTTLL